MSNETKTYEFSGTATVSVQVFVEAESEEQARAMVECGDVTWECEQVDGDVDNIELTGNPDEDDEAEEADEG